MLKISSININDDTFIYLPEEWHEKIINDTTVENESFPYQFKILEAIKIDVKDKQNTYICTPISDKKSELNMKIAISENVLKYLLSTEVPDSNIGFSFKEYFPEENKDILITGIKNPSNVIPAHIYVAEEYICLNEYGKIPYFDLMIKYSNGNGFSSLKYYTEVQRGLWKFLFNLDTSYMTDYEKMFQDTFIHKKYVKQSCKKLANYLISQGMVCHAKKLIERGEIHDNSKVCCEDELRVLSLIINDKSCLMDANKALSQVKKDALKLHWKHNSHHPEHFENFEDMEKIDVFEMICDWHARSIQYGTDLLEFVKIRQEERFHFPQYMFDEIYHYCEILVKL